MAARDVVAQLAPSAVFHQDRYARAIREHLAAGCRWLDIGAGTKLHDGAETGPCSPPMLRADASLLIGADVMREHLRRNGLLTYAVGADVEHLPFEGNSFDLVTANMVLEHLAAPCVVFGEVARVLRAGGLFVAVTPNVHHPVIYLASLLISARQRRQLANTVEGRALEHVFPTFYRANTARTLNRLAAAGNFDVVEICRFASIPFLQRPALLMALECLMIQASAFSLFSEFRSNLLLVLRRRSQVAFRA